MGKVMLVLAPFSGSHGVGLVCHKLGIALFTYYQHLELCQHLPGYRVCSDHHKYKCVRRDHRGLVGCRRWRRRS